VTVLTFAVSKRGEGEREKKKDGTYHTAHRATLAGETKTAEEKEGKRSAGVSLRHPHW